MSAVAATPLITPAAIRRARVMGIIFLLIGVMVLFVFSFGADAGSQASFGLSRGPDRFQVPDATVPVRGFNTLIAALCLFFGGYQLTRGFGKKANLMLGVIFGLFVLAFLAWAAAGKSFSLVGMLQATLVQAVPIALGAMAGVLCERVAIINIAIEGQLLMAAFVGTIVGAATNIYIGMLAAIGSLSLIHI